MTDGPAPARPPRKWVGTPYPLGASYDGGGTNFSIYSSVADGVELCLLGDAVGNGIDDEVRVELTEVDGFIWHTYLPDVRPGQLVRGRIVGARDYDVIVAPG